MMCLRFNGRRQCLGSRFALLLALMMGSWLVNDSFAQFNPPYPRCGVQHFGNAPADWYARFDLNIVVWTSAAKAREIKRINPRSIVIWVDGLTSYGENNPFHKYIPKEWFVQGSNGSELKLNWGSLLDMSNLCQQVNGKRYNTGHPAYLVSQIDMTAFDGVGSDWCWGRPHGTTDIDLDRNGKNDYDEHGRAWVDEQWQAGVVAFIDNWRKEIGPDKLIWINSGQFHDWGWANTNGVEIERQSGFVNWEFYIRQLQNFMQNARQPHILMMDVRPHGGDNNRPSNTKNYFQLARFMLTATMLGDAYMDFSPLEAGEHHYQVYFDEFDLDVGYPTQPLQKMSNGCFVRFFDKGVSIVNPSNRPVTLTDGDLRAMSGYAGPYYKFRGGQDPAFNSGGQFTQVNLWGGSEQTNSGPLLLGDGIILLTEPKTVIADILVDNVEYCTSPGSEPAAFTSLWQQTVDGDLFYSQKDRPSEGWYGHAFAQGGDGSQKATFTPTIGTAGFYEVYEWHGYVNKSQSSTNVPVTITYGSGQQVTKVVNQAISQGQWNSLGKYTFPAGRTGKVVIANQANGIIVADMIQFRYRGQDGTVDTQPPAPPTGIRVDR